MAENPAVPAVPERLLDVLTGEVLPATPENAARVLDAARDMKARLGAVVAEATDYLLEESRRQGTKTLAAGGGAKVVLAGGTETSYEGQELARALRDAGVPEERVAAAVTEEVSYKVNRSVVRQLAGANPAYAAAIAAVERTVEKPYRASVKR